MAISKITSDAIDATGFNLDSDTLTIDATNNAVGVGTASPNTYGKFVAFSSGGHFSVDTNGQVNSTQSIDVATAGGRFTGSSSRGALGSIHIEQTTTGADGGYIGFRTSPSGSTTPSERMRIDSSGRVTMPYQPSFHMENTTDSSIFKGGNVFANVGNHWNNTTGTFTAPVAGVYHFTLHGQSTNGSGFFWVSIEVNGTGKASWYDGTVSSSYVHAALGLTISLAANDAVTAEVRAGSVGVNTGGQNGFGGFLVG
jgi:C1q domain.